MTQNTVKSIDLVRHDLNLHAGCIEINTIVQLKLIYPFIFLDALNALYSAEKVQRYETEHKNFVSSFIPSLKKDANKVNFTKRLYY